MKVVNGGCGFDGGIINLLLFFSVLPSLNYLDIFIVSFCFASLHIVSFHSVRNVTHESGVK